MSLNKGLVGYWSFNEGSGIIAKDYSGNGNDGTLYGPTWVDGVSGKALSFDGVDDYVLTTLTPPKPITVSAWIYLNGYPSGVAPDGSSFITRSGGAIYFSIYPSGYIKFHMYNNGYNALISSSPCDLHKWYHVVGIWDGTTGADSQKLYINGQLDGANQAYATEYQIGTNTFTVGAQDATWNHFNGIIDEVRIYNRALSDDEIKTLYLNPPGTRLSVGSYEPVVTVTLNTPTPLRFASRDYYDEDDNFYKGSLLNMPQIQESLPDIYYGAEFSRQVTVELANNDSNIDDNWYSIVSNTELRDVLVSVYIIDAYSSSTLYTGKISQYDIRKDKAIFYVEMRQDTILDTLLPSKFITASEFDPSGRDLGKPINICFGKCRRVPLYNIRWDSTNEIYDYLIGFGPIEKLGIYDTSQHAIVRGGVYVDPSEYTFYDGTQATPYPGYAFVRFYKEQTDFSGTPYELAADLYGMTLGGTSAERNFARCIKALLSDPVFGLGDSCDDDSFEAAAAMLPDDEYFCDGAIVEQRMARDILNQMLLPARNAYIYRGADGEWEITIPGTGTSIATFGDNDGYWNNCEVVSIKAPSSSTSIKKINARFAIAASGDFYQTGDYWTGASFGTYKSYDLEFVDEVETVMKFFSLVAKLTTFDRRITLLCGLEARGLKRGDIITVIAPDKPPLETGKDWIVENIVRLPRFSAKSSTAYEITAREYDPSLYDDLSGGTISDLPQDDSVVTGPTSMVGPVNLGDGNRPATITLKGSTGDVYIAAGKTSFDNTQNGFILGLDYSDGNKAKFYLGNSSKYLYWDGTNWVLNAGNFQFDAEGNIMATNATIQGQVVADSGEVGGWSIDGTKLASAQIELDAANKRIRVYNGDNYVEISQNGLIGYSQELGETVNIPIDGSPPTFSAGVIKDAEHRLYTTGVIKTADSGRRIIINNNGIHLLTGATTGKYGSFKYGDGTKYGSGAILKLHNMADRVPLEFLAAQNVGDVSLANRSSDPSGPAEIGDLACVDGKLKICTASGTPGIWDEVGGDPLPDALLLGGM